MPSATPEEIKALIEAGEVTAITVDTSIFDQFECNLEYKSLTALEQFKHSVVLFILSPVTIGEVKAHIEKSIESAAEKVRASANQFLKSIRCPTKADTFIVDLGADVNPSNKAAEMVDQYISSMKAHIITEQASSDELLQLYFTKRAPFSDKGDKKAEFPDAIALLTLEKWAAERNTLVLAVSRDADWSSFCKNSNNIVCVENLSKALNLFNTNESVIASRITTYVTAGKSTEINQSITDALESFLEDFEVEANSYYLFEPEVGPASISKWSITNQHAADVVEADEDTITLSFDLDVEASFEAYFKFTARDGIDREYIRIGSTQLEKLEAFSVTLVATFAKSPRGDDKMIEDEKLLEVEIEGRGLTIDYGEIEPDY